jgi:hypothetical protein
MKSYNLRIRGLTPYMQHRMDDKTLEEWEKCRRSIIERPEVSQTDLHRAEYHCYRSNSGSCFIPADQLRGALINAGTYMKSKMGARSKSMKTIVAACFIVVPEEIIIPDYDSIDKRSAVNKNIKARVMVIRPKWSQWEASFTLDCYEETITIETIKQLFDYAGSYVGIGSFRPTNNGLFGRFEVIEIKQVL